jgi:LEA14-like dessication related protein
MRQSTSSTTLLYTASLLLGLSACAPIDIKEALEQQRPTVSVTDQRLTRLDFERANLAFGIQVDNPNPVALSLAGLDYDLKLDGHSFASGQQTKQMQLAAAGASRFELPLSLAFKEIYQGLANLKDKDEVPYELTTGLMIDVPLLGKLRYPVTVQGVLPLPRLPEISVKSLTMERLSFSGATLNLNLEVNNPNAFGLALNNLNYDFVVNGKRWLNGSRPNLGTVIQNQKNLITLPISLNFMEMGSSLYGLLKGGTDLDYSLSGKLDAHSNQKLIGNFAMPFDSSGRITLAQ